MNAIERTKTLLLAADELDAVRRQQENIEREINMDAIERAKVLLKATYELLEKQEESGDVLNLLGETIFYDGSECDGGCLKDDIEYWLDEFA